MIKKQRRWLIIGLIFLLLGSSGKTAWAARPGHKAHACHKLLTGSGYRPFLSSGRFKRSFSESLQRGWGGAKERGYHHSYTTYSNPFDLYLPFVGGTAFLLSTYSQKQVEATGYRGELGYTPYDCRYAEEFERQAEEALHDTRTFRRTIRNGSYVDYKQKKLEELKESLAGRLEYRFYTTTRGPYQEKKDVHSAHETQFIEEKENAQKQKHILEELTKTLPDEISEQKSALVHHQKNLQEKRTQGDYMSTQLATSGRPFFASLHNKWRQLHTARASALLASAILVKKRECKMNSVWA